MFPCPEGSTFPSPHALAVPRCVASHAEQVAPLFARVRAAPGLSPPLPTGVAHGFVASLAEVGDLKAPCSHVGSVSPLLGRAWLSRCASPVAFKIHVMGKESWGQWSSCHPAALVVGTSWSSHLLPPRAQFGDYQPSIHTRSRGPSLVPRSCPRCGGEGLGSGGGGATSERRQAAAEGVSCHFQSSRGVWWQQVMKAELT